MATTEEPIVAEEENTEETTEETNEENNEENNEEAETTEETPAQESKEDGNEDEAMDTNDNMDDMIVLDNLDDEKDEDGKDDDDDKKDENRRPHLTPEQRKLSMTIYPTTFRDDLRTTGFLSQVVIKTMTMEDLDLDNVRELMKQSKHLILKLEENEEGQLEGILKMNLASAAAAEEAEAQFESPRESLTCTKNKKPEKGDKSAYTYEKPKYEDSQEARMMVVGDLQADITEEQLRTLLPEDQVVKILIARGSDNVPKGYAYVELKTKDRVSELVKDLNGKELNGKAVIVTRLGRFPDMETVLKALSRQRETLEEMGPLPTKHLKALQNLKNRCELCLQNTPIPVSKRNLLRNGIAKLKGRIARAEKAGPMSRSGMRGGRGGMMRGGRGKPPPIRGGRGGPRGGYGGSPRGGGGYGNSPRGSGGNYNQSYNRGRGRGGNYGGGNYGNSGGYGGGYSSGYNDMAQSGWGGNNMDDSWHEVGNGSGYMDDPRDSWGDGYNRRSSGGGGGGGGGYSSGGYSSGNYQQQNRKRPHSESYGGGGYGGGQQQQKRARGRGRR